MIKLFFLLLLSVNIVLSASNIDKKIQTNKEKLDSTDDKKESTNLKIKDLAEKIESQNEVDFAFVDKVLGLSGEAGEVADKVKKVIRDQKGKLSANDKKAIGQELGDILWYVATSARYLGISLEQIASENIEKLESRLSRGKISGSGDER